MRIFIDRCRIYDLYWELESICDEIQNLADYGWFLEILGEIQKDMMGMSYGNGFDIDRCTIYNFYCDL